MSEEIRPGGTYKTLDEQREVLSPAEATIVLPIAASAGVNPVIPALAAVFGASYGFMLPVSTPRTPSSTARA